MTKKTRKTCRKGYSCGAGCISVTYACRKEFPKGISVSIDGMRTVIKNIIEGENINKQIEAKNKAQADVSSTIQAVNKELKSNFPASADQLLTNLKHRVNKNKKLSDEDKASLLKTIDDKKAEVAKAKKEFKAKADADAKARAKAEQDKAAKAKAEAEAKAKKAAEEAEAKRKAEEHLKAIEKKKAEDKKAKEEAEKKVIERAEKRAKELKAKEEAEAKTKSNKEKEKEEGIAKTQEFLKLMSESVSLTAEARRKNIEGDVDGAKAVLDKLKNKIESQKDLSPDRKRVLMEQVEKEKSKLPKPKKSLSEARKKIKAKIREVEEDIKFYNEQGISVPNQTGQRLNRLKSADRAVNPEKYLKISRQMAEIDAEYNKIILNKKLSNNDDLLDELSKKKDKLRSQLHQVYYGEPEKISKLKANSERPPIDNKIKSSLPKGGASEELKGFVDNAELLMQIHPPVIAKVLSGKGEFKNGFQRGTAGIGANRGDYYDRRKEKENALLDLTDKTKVSDRPKYGYLEHPQRALTKGALVGDNYGDFQVVFKPEVKHRSTMTVGDSLDHHSQFEKTDKATPVSDPKIPPKKSFNGTQTTDGFTIKSKDWQGNDYDVPAPYIEAQIHGKLTTADIQEVRVPNKYKNDPVVKQMTDNNITVRFIQDPPSWHDSIALGTIKDDP